MPAQETPSVLGLRPGMAPLSEAELPSSKSEAIRVLLCASLARGTTRLVGHLVGDDVEAALSTIQACGTPARRADGTWTIEGRPPAAVLRGDHGPAWLPGGPLSVGESGTLARVVLALVALCAPSGQRTQIIARGSLSGRSSGPLRAALTRAGARFEGSTGKTDAWADCVSSDSAPESLFLEDPVSSQEVSALLIALAAIGGQRRVSVAGAIPSRPYVELTRRVLERFGVHVAEETPGEWTVEGPLLAPDAPFDLEPDASGAAVLLAGACLSGGALGVPGLLPSSPQGDLRIVEYLGAFGCTASVGSQGVRACGHPRRGADLDLRGEPDLAPVLVAPAAAAALGLWGAPSPSRLTGLESLCIKESDRLAVLASGLRALGLTVETDGGCLSISPGGDPPTGPLCLDPAGDHRMAFSFALLGLLHPHLDVSDPTCVSKSWPNFWEQWAVTDSPGGSTPAS
jgi:3-phosphoshikimate 1-carboxyvinyltransferase